MFRYLVLGLLFVGNLAAPAPVEEVTAPAAKVEEPTARRELFPLYAVGTKHAATRAAHAASRSGVATAGRARPRCEPPRTDHCPTNVELNT